MKRVLRHYKVIIRSSGKVHKLTTSVPMNDEEFKKFLVENTTHNKFFIAE